MLVRKVLYVRCINCSYNNVTKGIRLLDKNAYFCLYRKNFMQVRAFERYIPLKLHSLEKKNVSIFQEHSKKIEFRYMFDQFR